MVVSVPAQLSIIRLELHRSQADTWRVKCNKTQVIHLLLLKFTATDRRFCHIHEGHQVAYWIVGNFDLVGCIIRQDTMKKKS